MKLERTLVWAIAAVSLAAPFLIAGVHPVTQLSLAGASLAMTLVLLASRRFRSLPYVPFLLPGACVLLVTLLQLLPLPSALVGVLSPNALALRDAVGQHGWIPLTVDLSATAFAALRAATCLGLLACTVVVVRSPGRARRLLSVLAFSGGAMAILHFSQRAISAHAILGIYQPRALPGSGFFGTFVAGNHAAAFFALTSLVAIGLALQLDGWRRMLLVASAALGSTALLSTLSRSGFAGFAVGAAALTVVLLQRRVGPLRAAIFTVGITALVGGAALWVVDDLRARFVGHSSGDIASSQKVRGWRDGLVLATHYPLTGVGRGAFESPLNAYRNDSEGVRLVYPENVVVQVVAECGFPIAIALAGLVGLSTRVLVRALNRADASTLAAACGVLAVFVHELADFSLELPGLAYPTTIALGVVIARAPGNNAIEKGRRRVRAPWLMATLAAWIIPFGLAAHALRHTQDADWQRLSEGDPSQDQITAAIGRHPAEAYFQLLAGRERLKAGRPAEALRGLNRALQLQPSNTQAHRLAARVLGAMHRRAQAALEYRLAAQNGLAAPYDELIAVAGPHVLDAVPQRPQSLVDLAANLAANKKPELAEAACGRGDELAQDDRAPVLARCLEIAVATGGVERVSRAAETLIAASPPAAGYVSAARALAGFGLWDRVDRAVTRGLAAHPGDPALVLCGADLALQRGDTLRARQLLRTVAGNAAFSLSDRIKAEDLTARVADREGDVEGAVGARARAKLLARRMHELEHGR